MRNARDPSIITATAHPARKSELEWWSAKNISLGFKTPCNPDGDISKTPSWNKITILLLNNCIYMNLVTLVIRWRNYLQIEIHSFLFSVLKGSPDFSLDVIIVCLMFSLVNGKFFRMLHWYHRIYHLEAKIKCGFI